MTEDTLPSLNENENRPYLSIVLPALDEELTIAGCIEEINKCLEKNGLSGEIIVSSSSTDRTDEISKSLGAVVIRPEKKGYGNAYLDAFKICRGDIIVIADADGTYELKKIPEFVKKIESGSSLVMGNRTGRLMEKDAMPPLHRYIGNPVLTWMLNLAFGTKISDAHCGMRAIKKEDLEKLNLKTPGMEFASEMIIEAARNNLSISEVEIEYYRRKAPSKLHSFADGWRHFRFMLLYQPLPFLAVPGFLFLAMGFVLMVLYYLEGNVENSNIHSFILGSILLIGGLQTVLTGINIKTYSVVSGYNIKTGVIERFLSYQNLEKEIVTGIVLMAAGAVIGLYIILSWIKSDFGSLFQVTNAIAALTLFISGMQIIFSAVLNSMMLMKYE
ncbi:glycosyltransferase involved in cell wall biosynthesis [Methanomicrobium sp. W14]|uniref:glycosyltransferase family 2 protein n=1 Tax=Methanomicrobium sp. W14 TaxID=2817839 RepID=UPI001AE7105E|nr:glycosyltransferase family 2 protein [Methanomicrobium sp. W14]MBP2134432.1 glycosyltransferase involved in cell wall biosynthesis [Methanomicrobium sp. W14]